MSATHALAHPHALPGANDRLKQRSRDSFWGGLLAATALHFVLLAAWPRMRAPDVGFDPSVMETVVLPQEYEVPPPPADFQRPAMPVIGADVSVDPDVTIHSTVFSDNPPESLPQPPAGTGVDVSEQPTFTPYEVKPDLRNRAEFARLLQRRYPSLLRDAGIGGTVVLWVFIDESGTVKNTRVVRSSGHEQLDQVAGEVMAEAKFTPALNRDRRVPVWIQLPVTFQTR